MMINGSRRPLLKPQLLLFIVCLIACHVEGSSRSQVLQTRYLNLAWTVGLPCSHPYLRNSTYSFMDRLGNATLQDLKGTSGVRDVMFLGKGPCRDLTASWNLRRRMAGYMYAFSFTSGPAVHSRLLAAAQLKGGVGLPDAALWPRTVALPMNDLALQFNNKPMRLRANTASTTEFPTFDVEQYALPGPPTPDYSPNPVVTETCANTDPAGSIARPYVCPTGWTLKSNADNISTLSDSSCCNVRATCANVNINVTPSGASTGVVPFVCPPGFALAPSAQTITAVNPSNCCVATPNCGNTRPNIATPDVNVPFTCPPNFILRSNASSITVLSSTSCCDVAPVNCSLIQNSAPDATTNTCQCTKSGFLIKALDNNTLKECLASPASTCPAAYPVEIKSADPSAAIEACMTASSKQCPSGFPLMMFSGNPSVLQECRPPTQQCVAPYDLPVTGGSGATLLACTSSSDNVCPMGAVPYREFNSTVPWALQQCRLNGACSSITDRFGVPALTASGSTVACLTLDSTPSSTAQQACPSVPGVDFPVEVTRAAPLGCGTVTSQCTSAVTVACLPSDATCPRGFPFQLVRYDARDVPGTLAGCRSPRSSCDLSMLFMQPQPAAGADPNALDNGNYTIRLMNGGSLAGCMQGGANACPSSFAFPARNTSGTLLECGATGSSIAACPVPGGNPQNTVAAENQNGMVVECLSPFAPCPPSYPVAARNLAGSPPAVYIEKCMARTAAAVCPSRYPFPFFAPLPDPATAGGSITSLTNCWEANVVTACNFQVLNGPQGTGVGTYSIEVRQNATAPLQGCLLAGTTTCPSVFSFAYYSAPSTLARCASSDACPVSGGQYTIPLMDQGAVTGCGTGSCPDAFPVPAAAAGGSPVTCLTTRSRCSSVSGNFVFSLFRAGPPAIPGGLPTPVLERCIPSPAGITTCSSITEYTGLELYNSLGALVGCTTSSVTTCPMQFPIALYNAAGGLVSCRANITGTCGSATGNQFPTQIIDDRGRLTGCTAAPSCPNVPGVVVLSETVVSTPEYCMSLPSNSCPPAQLYNDRSFPLFSGVTSNGMPRLVRCIKPIAATECNTTAAYTVELKGTIDGSSSVVGCMTATPATPCPFSAPFFYLASNHALVECRPGVPASCGAAEGLFANYTVPMLSGDGGTLQGCMQAGARRCPTTASGALYNHPFFLLGDGLVVDECRQAGSTIQDCQSMFTNHRNTANLYIAEVIANSVMGGTGIIVGCAKHTASCSAATGYGTAQVSATGAVEACRPTNSACSGSYPLQLQDATGAAVEGCAPNVTQCPDRWPFPLYSRTAAATPAAKLTGCQSAAAGNITSCTSEGYPVRLLDAAGTIAGCSAVNAQCPDQYPRWILDSTAALDSCRVAEGFTCPTSAPIAMINNTDAGSSLPLLGCIAGTSCPAAAPANAVPTSEAYTLFSLTSNGAVAECWPAASSPSNACNGGVSVVDATGTVLGCTQSTSCPASFFELYAARSAQDNTAVLTSCVATQPECGQNPMFSTPIYNSTLGAANVGLAGCKAAEAACPPSAPFMALSATSNAATQPSIEGCYKSFAAGTTCPRTGRHTVPLCTWSSLISTGCSGTQVQGCLGSGSTRCFSSSAAGNVDRAYPFVVGSVGGTPPQVTSLLACYQRPVPATFVPSCPVAAPVKALWSTGEAGACVRLDTTSSCKPWWVTYNGDLDAGGLCTV